MNDDWDPQGRSLLNILRGRRRQCEPAVWSRSLCLSTAIGSDAAVRRPRAQGEAVAWRRAVGGQEDEG